MKVPIAVAAALAVASVVAAGVSAQTPAPPMQSILAGKKIVPPVKGQADVDYVKPKTERKGSTVVTKIQVKNMSAAPIARLKIIETWFDKSGGTIPGGEGVINGLLQPGEVQTIEIQTPYSANLSANSWNFLHANGSVKPHLVKSFDGAATAAKEPPTKTAAKKK
ncbi:MAG TPA: hypothetical protein VGY48_04610 [Vicinamibacterales bacterium]|jgi:hypothetical protein|nr:hypothetical protein [Vicinamibacterales bacterium]